MNKRIINMAIVTAIIYMVVLLLLSGDYSQGNLLKVGVQGVIFALVFGLATWLLERYRNRKK